MRRARVRVHVHVRCKKNDWVVHHFSTRGVRGVCDIQVRGKAHGATRTSARMSRALYACTRIALTSCEIRRKERDSVTVDSMRGS